MPLSAAQGYPISELGRWLESPPGRYLLAWEQARLDEAVSDVFGFFAVQVGLHQIDGLRANRMPFKGCVGDQAPGVPMVAPRCNAFIVAEFEELPFDSQSIDLLVLPHTLEVSADPHQVLREAERVLMPEGRLIVTGFNPWSLWGAGRLLGQRAAFLPTSLGPLPVPRLKDWLKLLSFEVDRAHFGGYVPPCSSDVWLQRFAFMENAGAKWWPFCGSLYIVSAVKRQAGMRLLGPPWKTQRLRRHAAVAVAPRMNAAGPDSESPPQ